MRGQVTNMRFGENGVVRAQFGSNEIVGSWLSTGTQLCFTWAASSRECWPYTRSLVPGETVTLTSDRGNVVRITLQPT
jgi:transposase